MDKSFEIVRLRERPDLTARAAEWFSEKWSIPCSAYVQSIRECQTTAAAVPRWYVVLHKDEIVAGIGVIENDFHERKDLSPNVCAVCVQPQYRRKGIAREMLSTVCDEFERAGIDTLYLLTDHTDFYERCGWEFLCAVKADGESKLSRMYVHRPNDSIRNKRNEDK